MSDFKVPPPFVRCNCTYGRYTQFVKSAPGSALDGAEYVITKPCGVCAGSPIPGWIPQYYTPEQYRDWIRLENDLPDYELSDRMPVWDIIFSNKGDFLFYELCELHFVQNENVIIATDAGRPPEDWKP